MKKISIIVMALVFLVALTQCKKEQATPANDGKTVDITLDIKSSKGTRMDVNTVTGEVTYVSGDKIYVASGGKYVGTLTHNGTRFGGTITDPIVGEPLDFYFLGNVTPAETLTAGSTTTCSVIISDQTEHLPVIEYAPSNETYTAGATTFTAHLLNKCALVKFNVTTASEAAVCVTGFNNKVTVNFSENTLANSKEGNGVITLPAGYGEKWAILLPQEALEEGLAYSEDGDYTGTRGAVPAVYENGYFTVGIEVNVTTEVNPGEVPVGAISGKFTINAEGDQVYFSQGNLQYIGSAASPYWKFADNQWDYLGTTTGQNSTDQDVDRDLFGWGTSGFNHGANANQPWSTSVINTDYYVYGSFNYNLFDQTGQADWGYNPISNGGNQSNLWQTLTTQEWLYVFTMRMTTTGIHYARGNVNGTNGMILLPDDWDVSYYTLTNTDISGAGYNSNEISVFDWITLEQHGAVFLPAAGCRQGTSIGSVNYGGYYWSASYYDSQLAYYAYFFNNTGIGTVFNPQYNHYRSYGRSVRLVRNAE